MKNVAKIIYGLLLAVVSQQLFAQQSVTQQWSVPFNINGSAQSTNDMAIDDSGYVYIAGMTSDTNYYNYGDGFVLKISPAGSVMWSQTYGNLYWQDWFNTVSVDDSGNVYAAGVQNYQAVNIQSAICVKYNRLGQLQWVDTLPALWGIDNVCPANGTVLTLINNKNITLQKHTGSQLAWRVVNDTSMGGSYMTPKFLKIDGAGNMFVGGDRGTSGESRYFVKKFDINGAFIWNAEFNPGIIQYDVAEDMELDNIGNVYIAGRINSASGGLGVAKFRPSGDTAWMKTYTTSIVTALYPSIAVDGDGNVYLSGQIANSSGGGNKCHVIKYDSTGTLKWDIALDSAYNHPTDVTVDVNGRIYVSYCKLIPGTKKYFMVALSPVNGGVLWQASYGTSSIDNYPVKLLANNGSTNPDIYVTGIESFSGWNYATTVKYGQTVGLTEFALSNEMRLFPNPFSYRLTIQPLAPFRSATICIYNCLGEKAQEYKNISGEKADVSRENLPSGIYFLIISDDANTYSGKVIIE